RRADLTVGGEGTALLHIETAVGEIAAVARIHVSFVRLRNERTVIVITSGIIEIADGTATVARPIQAACGSRFLVVPDAGDELRDLFGRTAMIEVVCIAALVTANAMGVRV